MIQINNRVPGQLLPVGARYWANMGKPINALQGLGQTLTSEEAAALILSEGSDVPTAPIATRAAVGVGTNLIIAGVLVRGALGYAAGRAMAPSAAQKNTYGWWGVLAGGVFGVPGLALQGAMALSKKK